MTRKKEEGKQNGEKQPSTSYSYLVQPIEASLFARRFFEEFVSLDNRINILGTWRGLLLFITGFWTSSSNKSLYLSSVK